MVPVQPDVTAVRWHPRQPSKILIGTDKGNISLYNLDKKAVEISYQGVVYIDTNIKNSVIDLLWNPGEDVFLTLFKDGSLRLYGQEEVQHKMEFEALSHGISKVCWMDNISGDFITSSVRVGAIKIWNAAQP